MNLEAIRSAAETGQAASYALRNIHRTAQKEAEVEEQFFKKVMKAIDKRCEADRELEAVLSEAPAAVLQKLDMKRPEPVESSTPMAVAAVVHEAAPALAPKLGEGVTGLADEIYTLFVETRHGKTASMELETIYRSTGKGKRAVDTAINNLISRGLIQRCRKTEAGWISVILKGEEVAA